MPESLKKLAACAAVKYVTDGMVVGLGTGSTAEFAIRALGKRCASENIAIKCVPTSEASRHLGIEVGLTITSLDEEPAINLTIDGADEVAADLNLIKGLGGALLREKVVASATTQQIIIVDPSKVVGRLGTRSPLPVEVIPFASPLVQRRLSEISSSTQIRCTTSGHSYTTDNGNFIIDCTFQHGIDDPVVLEKVIDEIPGVVANGLFVGLTDLVIVGQKNGTCQEMRI